MPGSKKWLLFLCALLIVSSGFSGLTRSAPAEIYAHVGEAGAPENTATIYMRNLENNIVFPGDLSSNFQTNLNGDCTLSYDLGILPGFSFANNNDRVRVFAVKGERMGYEEVTIIASSGITRTWTNITLATVSPPTATDLRVTIINTTAARLQWDQNINAFFAKYQVYISQDSAEIGVLADVITDPTNTSIIVTNLEPDTKYYFRVRSYDFSSRDAQSNLVSINTGGNFPTSYILIAAIVIIIVVLFIATVIKGRKTQSREEQDVRKKPMQRRRNEKQ